MNLFGRLLRRESTEEKMERFYEEYFSNETKEARGRWGQSEYEYTNSNINQGLNRIREASERIDIDPGDLAYFCFRRLIRAGMLEMAEGDEKFYGPRKEVFEDFVKKGEDEMKTIERHKEMYYNRPKQKFKAAEELFERFDFDEKDKKILKVNIERIEFRFEKLNRILDLMKSGDVKDALDQLENLIRELKGQKEKILEQREEIS